MPTTITQEKEYEDIITIIYSLLFLLGLATFVWCCVYCIIKKEESNKIEYRRSNIDIV
jgi:hypothetical protein